MGEVGFYCCGSVFLAEEDVGSGGVRGVRADPGDGSHFPLQSSEIHGALHRP